MAAAGARSTEVGVPGAGGAIQELVWAWPLW